jgi:hypothetical protein
MGLADNFFVSPVFPYYSIPEKEYNYFKNIVICILRPAEKPQGTGRADVFFVELKRGEYDCRK